jgi:hypothetical protein
MKRRAPEQPTTPTYSGPVMPLRVLLLGPAHPARRAWLAEHHITDHAGEVATVRESRRFHGLTSTLALARARSEREATR